jgi:hypothetical protein
MKVTTSSLFAGTTRRQAVDAQTLQFFVYSAGSARSECSATRVVVLPPLAVLVEISLGPWARDLPRVLKDTCIVEWRGVEVLFIVPSEKDSLGRYVPGLFSSRSASYATARAESARMFSASSAA